MSFLPTAQFSYLHGLQPSRVSAHSLSYGVLWPGSANCYEWTACFQRHDGLLRVRQWRESATDGYWYCVFEGYVECETDFLRLLRQLGWPLPT